MEKQAEPTIFLQFIHVEDLLKVILYSSQSPLGPIPMLYHIEKNGKHMLFVQTGGIGSNTVHYVVQATKPEKKFIELKRLTGDFTYVEKIGNDSMSLYIPILELEKTNLDFP